MASNPFESTIDELDQDDQAKPAPAPANPFLETLETIETQRTQQMRTATINAIPQDPERAAKVRKMSNLTGLAPEVVERNYEQLEKRTTVEGVPFGQIAEETPHLAEWVTEKNNAALAKDDMEQLGALEWLMQAPSMAFARSVHHMRVASLRTQQLYRNLTQEELDSLNAEKAAAERGGALGVGDSWFKGAVTGGSELLANVLTGAWYAGPKAALGAGVGAIIGGGGGALAGGVGAVPGAIAGAKFGFGVGAAAGSAQFGFELEAGLAFDEFMDPKWKDEFGQAMDPDVARVAAIAAGTINAGLEVAQLGKLASTIPGLKQLKGAVTRDSIKLALRNPTVRAALKEAALEYGKTLTFETATEVAQRGVTILAGELGKAADANGARQRSAGEIAQDLANEAVGALQGFALLAPAGIGVSLAHEVGRAHQADQAQAWFQALGEGAAASKTIERMPEAAQELLQRATEGGPIENVYAPTAPFRQYFQTAGLNPEKVAAELTGDPLALQRAEQLGQDLEIRTSVYAVRLAGTEHHAALASELRLGADAMNAREAAEFREKVTAELEARKAQVEQEQETPGQAVRRQVVAELVGAGVPERTAEQYATLYESAFGAMAERAGLSPEALYAHYGLTVEGPVPASQAAPGETTAPAPGGQAGSQTEALLEAAIQPAGPTAEPGAPAGPGPEFTPVGEEPQAGEGEGGGPAFNPDDPMDFSDPVRAANRMMLENPRIVQEAEALRARSAASRKQAPPRAGAPGAAQVESAAEATGGEAAATEALGPEGGTAAPRGEQLPGDVAQPEAAPAGGLQPERGEAGGARQGGRRSVPPSQRERVSTLLADARANGFAGRDVDLVKRFLDRYDTATAIAADLEAEGNLGGWRQLLTRISELGGIGLNDFPNDRGETMQLLDTLAKSSGIIKKSGRHRVKRQGQRILPTSVGIRGAAGVVVQKGGRGWDDIRDAIAGDSDFPESLRERWANLSTFQEDVMDAAIKGRAENLGEDIPGRLSPSVESVLEDFLEVKPGTDWWKQPAAELDELVDLDDRTELGQTLFDDLLDPKVSETRQGDMFAEQPAPAAEQVDVLETGEQQPRLPGAGEVRETEVATPEFEAPFSLTAPVDKSKKGKQTTLFQEQLEDDATARIAQLPAVEHPAVPDARQVPFPALPNDRAAIPLLENRDKGTRELRTVPLADIVTTQTTFSESAALGKLEDSSSTEPVEGIEYQGKVYLLGGTHRAIAEWAQGAETIEMEVEQVKPGAELALEEPVPAPAVPELEAEPTDPYAEAKRLYQERGAGGSVVRMARALVDAGVPLPTKTRAEKAAAHALVQQLLGEVDGPRTTFYQGPAPAAIGTNWRLLDPLVTPEEKGKRRDVAVKAIMGHFRALPSAEEYADIALAGAAARGWYEKSGQAIRLVFGEVDAPRFTALLAATSPRVQVAGNLENALRIWVAWNDAKRPTTKEAIDKILRENVRGTKGDKSVLDAWRNNTFEALTHHDPTQIVLSGPKVESFQRNLLGHMNEVTADAWMAVFAGATENVYGSRDVKFQQVGRPARILRTKTPRYIATAAKIRQAAQILTERTGEKWTAAEVQETVWSWAKTLYELSSATKTPAAKLLQSGQLTDAVIAAAPDFAKFLSTNPSFRAILEVAGYGEELNALERTTQRRTRRLARDRKAAAPGRGAARGARAAAGREDRSPTLSELRAARRLDRVRSKRKAAKADDEVTLYQPALQGGRVVDAPAFYSRLRRAVEDSTQGRASGKQWKAAIKNSKLGVNADEFALANVGDLRDDQVYTREEILEYLRLNQVEIVEVTLGEPIDQNELRERAMQLRDERHEQRREEQEAPDFSEEAWEFMPESSVRIYDEDEGTWEYVFNDEQSDDSWDTQEEAEEALEERKRAWAETEAEFLEQTWIENRDSELEDFYDYDDARKDALEELQEQQPPAQYGSYVLPGGLQDTYREVFLTAPTPRQKPPTEQEQRWMLLNGWIHEKTPVEVRQNIHGDQRFHTVSRGGDWSTESYDTAEEAQAVVRPEAAEWLELERAGVAQTARERNVHPAMWSNDRLREWALENLGYDPIANDPSLTHDELARLVALERLDRGLMPPAGWEDGHSDYQDIQNPVVRVRYDLREAESGELTLFIHEIQPPQSDQQDLMPRLYIQNWRELGLKYALKQAVELGAKRVAWTTGQMQIDLYPSVESVVDNITWFREGGQIRVAITPRDKARVEAYRIMVDPKTSKVMHEHAATERWRGAPLDAILGKELAEKILKGEETGRLEGEGLKVGGRGLRRLYDVDFPNVANKLPALKKAGVKVTPLALEDRAKNTPEYLTAKETFEDAERAFLKHLEEEIGVGRRDAADYLYDVRQRTEGTVLKGLYEHSPELEQLAKAVQTTYEAYKGQDPTPRSQVVPVSSIEITDALRQQVKQGQAYFSPEHRGQLSFGADRQMTISLFGKMDLSTFLHESGHFFLEVMSDLNDQVTQVQTRTPQQEQLAKDYATLLAWFGVNNRYDIKTEHHEKLAGAFEAYLMEGKAPSVELQSVFSRFRAWMLGVYKSLQQLIEFHRKQGSDVRLNDEVRAVFDRMLATDQAIEQASAQAKIAPMFLTAEQAGMTPERFALYQDKVAKASQAARDRLERKLMAEVARERDQVWKEERAELEKEVTAALAQLPVYRALEAMRTGRTPDGKPLMEGELVPLKLSKQLLVDRFGADRVRQLPRPYIYTVKKDGMDPDGVAEAFGFDSADAMLNAIEVAPPFKEAVKQETDQRMLQRHGSMLLDGTLLEEAQGALSNEEREEVIRAELRALGSLKRTVQPFVTQERKEGRAAVAAEREKTEEAKRDAAQLRATARAGAAYIRGAIPDPNVLREMAQRTLATTKVKDIRPAPFWAASRRAAQRAVELAAKQDLDGAIVAKQQELINLALHREAMRVLEDVDARVRRARNYATDAVRAQFGLAGESYLDQIDGILDRYEFARVSEKVLRRRASVRKFVAGIEGEGIPVDLPEEVLEEVRRVNFREIPYEELVGVVDGMDQLAHLARLKNRLLKNKQKRELADVTTHLAESIRTHARGTRREEQGDRRPSEERRRSVSDFFGSHRKLASLLRELDGFKDGGPAWEAIMRPLNAAADAEQEMQAEATRELGKLIEAAFPGAKAKRELYQKTQIASIGKSLSRMQRIMVAMNWGNEGNRDRLMRGRNWTKEQVQDILDGLTAAELQFVQGVFDFVDSYWPEIAAKQQRVYGLAPEKVEATEIRTKNGTIRGGYFPLKADDRLSASAIAHLDLESAELAKKAAFTNATTKRGHTKARVESAKYPVRLDFGVMFEHVQQVIHDLSHHETLVDVGRILSNKDVQEAILEVQGDLVFKQIRNTIRDVAFGDVPATNGFEKAINHIRSGASIAGLGWNLGVSLLQPIGLTNSIVRIGPRWVAKGIGKMLRHPTAMVETVKWIEEVSPFMRGRARTMNREIAEIRTAVGVETGSFSGLVDTVLSKTTFDLVTKQGIADSYFWIIQQAQRLADVPTWLGAYEKARNAGEPDDRAIAMADQAVLDSQGGGQIKDLSSVQRGGPMMKLWTSFYSYFNVLYNQAAESRRRTSFKNPVEVGRLASDYFMLFIAPATIGFMIREALRSNDKDDDDDFLLRLALENVSYLMGTMLGLREVAGLFSGATGYEGPAGSRAFSAVGRLGRQTGQILAADSDKERMKALDQAFWRSLNDVAGVLLHYPSSQVWKTLTGISALAEGETTNPGAVIAGPPREKK